MRAFDYATAGTVDEAVSLLSQPAASGRPLAGGTDLLTLMKADIIAPARLIDIKRAAGLSSAIEPTADGLTLGALTSLAAIEQHPLIRQQYPALAEAVAQAATPQLRTMATIGGNLLQRPRCWYYRNALFHCWLKGGDHCPARDGENQQHALLGDGPCYAVHPSDAASALIALDARVRWRGRAGEQVLPLAELFALPTDERRRENLLGEDELLLALHVPVPAVGTRSTYLKAMDRRVWAFALVGVAASIQRKGRQIDAARLVLSGVAPVPWRAVAAERLLIGAEPEPALFAHVAEVALADARPLAHNGYKRPLAAGLIQRALADLTD